MFTIICVFLSVLWASSSVLSPTNQFVSIRRRRVWCSLVDGWDPGWGTRRQSLGNSFAMQQMASKWNPGMNPIDFATQNIPDFDQGPSKKGAYNPNYGYEPHWAGGDWLLKPPSNLTTRIERNDYCNNKCSPSYIAYGFVCARASKSDSYKTFENYCQMRADDCDGKNGWILAYAGNCTEVVSGGSGGLTVFNTVAKDQPRIKNEIIDKFYNTYTKEIGSGRIFTSHWGYSPVIGLVKIK